MDKFLITARKIEPVSYTFFTVVTGAALLVIWPLNFAHISASAILFDLFSGAFFSLATYIFFVTLAKGEVSRVIPFVFGLVPLFDVLIGLITHTNLLTTNQAVAMFVLIPGAFLVSYQKGKLWGKHVALKILSAFLFSSYYALWHAASQTGPFLNNLMWNRLGAALILVALLIIPAYRKKVLNNEKVENKGSTSFIFLFKQALGGANFIFFSALLSLGTVSIINALQGFRYVFLLFFSSLLSKKRRHLIEEQTGDHAILQKSFGIALIFLGTIFLFIKF